MSKDGHDNVYSDYSPFLYIAVCIWFSHFTQARLWKQQ